jgi:chorismate mutase
MNTEPNVQIEPARILAECRQRIDRIDGVLLALLRERLRTAEEAADAKAALGQPVLAPPREAEVLARVTTLASSPLEPGAAARIFELIIEETRATAVRRTEGRDERAPHRPASR